MPNPIEYTALGVLALFIFLFFKYLINDRKHEHQVRRETNKVLRKLSVAVQQNTDKICRAFNNRNNKGK